MHINIKTVKGETEMKKIQIWMISALLLISAGSLAGCGNREDENMQQETAGENAGTTEKAEDRTNAADSHVNGVTDNREENEGAVGGVIDDVGDAGKDLVDGVGEAGKDLIDGVENAGDEVLDGAQDLGDQVTGETKASETAAPETNAEGAVTP